MKKLFDPPKRDRWARLRFSVIGALMASPPEPGGLRQALLVLAAKTWRHPDSGLDVQFGVSTLERGTTRPGDAMTHWLRCATACVAMRVASPA